MSDGQTPQHPQPADDNPYQRASAGWTGTESHHTQPLPPAYGAQSGFPVQQPTQAPPRERAGRGRAGLVAAVVATSLLVGGGAGIGGAAWWDATQDGSGGSSQTSPVSTSPVASQSQTPAADGSVESVAQKVLPSVVKIDVTTAQGGGSGSGIVLTADGTILTNNHVVEGAEAGSLTVSFDDGTSAEAEVLGTDPLTDTAVIKAAGVSDLTPATIGKSANLGVGESVVAIGSPFGLDATVTSGIVSALDRPVNVGSDDQGNSTTYPAIQTDAAINPGNSGGPLVNLAGEVVGVNSAIATNGGASGEAGNIGVGFAIPIEQVRTTVDQILRTGEAEYPVIGAQVRTGGEPDANGATITEVMPDTPAERAGLEKDDVITAVDDQPVSDGISLIVAIRTHLPGETVEMSVVRGGEERVVQVELDGKVG
ncbi:serine protease PepD [Planomonospora venezuelensis]|nr:serine protease PepD [Planomonospora venezuelensis]